MCQRRHSKLTEHVAFLARRDDFGGKLATSNLFTLMKSLNVSFVPKAVLKPSLEIHLIQMCLWILHKKFMFQTTKNINYKHFQCLKQSLKALLEINFSMYELPWSESLSLNIYSCLSVCLSPGITVGMLIVCII